MALTTTVADRRLGALRTSKLTVLATLKIFSGSRYRGDGQVDVQQPEFISCSSILQHDFYTERECKTSREFIKIVLKAEVCP